MSDDPARVIGLQEVAPLKAYFFEKGLYAKQIGSPLVRRVIVKRLPGIEHHDGTVVVEPVHVGFQNHHFPADGSSRAQITERIGRVVKNAKEEHEVKHADRLW